MANKIFESLLLEKIDFFKLSFSGTSGEIFWDGKNEKMLHNGEYGTYREAIVRDFLKFMIPRNLDVSTGFLITPMGDVGTQCDVIIFDSNMTPLYEDGDRQKFFPVESVFAIGEIKSTLSKSDFKKAINKLAKNKKLSERMKNPVTLKSTRNRYDPIDNHRDTIPSFLVCQKFDFDFKDIENEIDGYYDKDIETRHKHNMILSIEDGLLCYFDSNDKTLPFPRFRKIDLKNRFNCPNKDGYVHFKLFSSYMFLLTEGKTLFYPEFTDYMGSITDGIKKDQK